MTLDTRRGAAPLWQQLRETLQRRIAEGAYPPGSMIPTENELIREFGVSRMTVRQAVGALASEGLVEGRRGIGTIVLHGKMNEELSAIRSFSEEMARQGVVMETVSCSVTTGPAPAASAAALGLKEGDRVVVLERVRAAKGVPLVYSVSRLPLSLGLPLDSEPYRETLYGYLRKEMGMVVASAVDTIEAVTAQKDIAARLGVKEGSAMLKRSRVSRDSSGRAFEHSVSWYPGDRYKYTVEL